MVLGNGDNGEGPSNIKHLQDAGPVYTKIESTPASNWDKLNLLSLGESSFKASCLHSALSNE